MAASTEEAILAAQEDGDGAGDGLIIAPVKPGDGGSRPAGRAHRAAVGGKASNIFLLMDGHQIADCQRAVHFFF